MPAAKKAAVVRRKSNEPNVPDVLLHAVPEPWYGDQYISRMIGGHVDAKVLATAKRMGHNTLIDGPTGVAKTSFVYAYGAGYRGETQRRKVDGVFQQINVVDRSLAMPVVYVPCDGAMEMGQLLFSWVPQSDGSFAPVVGDLLLAIILGGIGYFDEINFAPPRATAFLHGLFDKRRMVKVKEAAGAGLCGKCATCNGPDVTHCGATGSWAASGCGAAIGTGVDFQAHEDFQAVATYNPEYEGTRPMNQAFVNRFAFVMSWDYSHEIEDQLLYSDSLLEMIEKLRVMYREGELRTPISTNKAMEFEQFALDPDLGLTFASQNFVNCFHADEKPSITPVLEAHFARIKEELAPFMESTYTEDDGEDA